MAGLIRQAGSEGVNEWVVGGGGAREKQVDGEIGERGRGWGGPMVSQWIDSRASVPVGG